MVDSHPVDEAQVVGQALDPPAEASRRDPVPAVEGIAPQLAGAAEGVGGDAGDHRWAAHLIEEEQVGIRPHVGRVARDEDRDIAEDPDPELAGRLAGKYMTFKLADEEYGLEILKVQEINGMMDITPVPQSPEYVRGVINLRGRVVPLPGGPLSFATTSLFSWGAKLRLLKEPFIPRPAPGVEESIAQFVRRRLGQEFLDSQIFHACSPLLLT